jgi:S-DNA-T family DNA segregation ATPase FtsK/SpoIIIE
MQLGAAQGLAEGEEKDPLYNDAVDIMIETGRGSVSLIQRRLNIGYSRASRLIDQMRRTGIVGAYKGSMASEVVVSKEEWEAIKAADGGKAPLGGDGTDGSTGGRTGTGANAGFAQQVNTAFEEDDEDGVPDEMPGEHRL